jgi:thiol-disulfide isomerase/thioredoxin
MPSLGGATEWLNSEPLGAAELRGHVVLVNFWTWTCINWLRQEPYVRAWSQTYRDDGLIVIGVHTPEFSFEHEVDGVRRVTEERAIDYPVIGGKRNAPKRPKQAKTVATCCDQFRIGAHLESALTHPAHIPREVYGRPRRRPAIPAIGRPTHQGGRAGRHVRPPPAFQQGLP